jgi:hypothetical protein
MRETEGKDMATTRMTTIMTMTTIIMTLSRDRAISTTFMGEMKI